MRTIVALLLAAVLAFTDPAYAQPIPTGTSPQLAEALTTPQRECVRKRRKKMRVSYLHQLDPIQVDTLVAGETSFEQINQPGYAFFGLKAIVFKTEQNVTVNPVISIGDNDPDYNNLASGVTITPTTPQYIDLGPWPIAPDAIVKVKVTTPATADTFSITVYPFFLYTPL